MDDALEADVLQGQVAELEAEGYDVYIHPHKRLLPGFLAGQTPDLLARRKEKGVVLEVLRRSTDASRRLEQLNQLLKDQPNWELRVVWLDPATTINKLDVQPTAAIEARISEMKGLLQSGNVTIALLLGWATFEALGRAVMPDAFQRPQTPARLVRELAAAGHVTPTEADELRRLADKRNRFVHGGLETPVARAEVERLIEILTILKTEIDQK